MINKWQGSRYFFSVIMIGIVCSVAMSGCSSFRRKFIRQNKNKDSKEAFIPVLEPLDYPRQQALPIDTYKSHYSMVKAYLNDFYASFGSLNSGEKRERYLLAQIIAHLQGMTGLLNEGKKPQGEKVILHVQEAMKELDKPAGMRRYDLLEGAVRKVEGEVRKTLKPDMVKEFIGVQ